MLDHNDVMELLIDRSKDGASEPQCQIIKHSQMAALSESSFAYPQNGGNGKEQGICAANEASTTV